MSKTKKSNKKHILVLNIIALIALGVGGTNIYAKSQASMEMPAPNVTVKTLKSQDIRIWSSFSGRMQAVDYAEIRPEVSGRIVDVRIRDGQMVKAGDILFVIDPQPYKAALAKAEANLVIAKLKATLAKTEFSRAQNMIKTAAISKSLYDARDNDVRIASADILATEASVKQAQIDVDRAYIKAPIAGRVSRAEITIGNVVQAGSGSPVLTSIVSNQGIYADFDIDEQTYMNSIRENASTLNKELDIPVELTVLHAKSHPYKGEIYSFDNRIDSTSGTIRARAKFSNADGRLIPGMFVSMRVASSTNKIGLLVPERAIGSDQNKKFVYVVGSDNKVAYREVTLGDIVDDQRVIISGAADGERVVIDGLQHIRPDMVVNAQEAPAGK